MSENSKSESSNSQEWMKKIEEIAGKVCQGVGCILYDVEFTGLGKGRTLRVFVDKETGVGIEDCSNVSKGLNEFLDESDLIPGGEYNLEVSTPGVDRVLTKPWHFEKAVGKKISVRSRVAMEELGITDKKWKNAKHVEEVLSSTDGESITFVTKEAPLKIPYSVIEKAKVVFEMKQHGPKKK